MSSINIYSEVLEKLKEKLNENQMQDFEKAYDNLERDLKLTKLDVMSMPNLDDFVFPNTIAVFKLFMENLKQYATQAKNQKVIARIDRLLATLPKDEVTATVSTHFYNQLQENYDSIPIHINKVRMHNNSEANMSNLLKIVKDYIIMNELNTSIEIELDEVIKYFASRISDNEQGSLILFDRNYSYWNSCVKLAAYLNLNTGCKIDIEQPDISVKSNLMLLEISLYNGFLSAIIKIANYWKNKIFNHFNSVEGDNLPTDTVKRIDKIVKSPMQYDSVFKAISISIDEIVKNKMTKFVNAMKEYQDSKKLIPSVQMTEPEALALEELFVTRLGKHAPKQYLKQWV